MVRKFDYSFLKELVPVEILDLTNIIYDIKGKEDYRLDNNPKLFSKLKSKAIIDSIKASNEIENIVTTEKRIRDIANGDNKPLTHAEEEITGYRNVLNNIHNNYEHIIIDERTILSMHKEMLDIAKKENRGNYKKDVNIITETINGKQYIRFKPISPKDTKEAMEQLLLAYYDAKQKNVNPLLLIPCFILDFLSIHPFDDGNGRMSRLLTLLLLYKHGFNIGKFISIENVISYSKTQYYDVLKKSSIGWHENENDYFPFIIYMIQVIYKCYQKLDENVFDQIDKKISKAQMVEELVINAYVPISKSEIIDKLPTVSQKTIESVLSKLLNENKIIKIGTYKDAQYYRK